MSDKEKTKGKDTDLSLKNAASKLDISEATIKKYLKDFELPVGKGPWNKALIAHETFQALLEIVKLRANGLSISEIKELKTQEPSKHVIDEVEETPILVVAEEEKPKVEETVIIPEIAEVSLLENLSASESSSLNEDGNETSETSEDSSSIDLENTEESSEGDGQDQKRRRGFNYRYVERQISSDSKRVSSIRIRLKNPNLSVQDRMFFEEALERRILFLNGWKHILKWIAK